MFTLKAESRNTGLKSKQLRRKGIVPGVLYGKDLKESLNIQISQRESERFLKSNTTGSQVELVIDDKKFQALLRKVTYRPATGEVEHLNFQTLLAGEALTSTVRIVLFNREKVSGMIQQPHDEISYRTLPKHLIDVIEIDLDGMEEGDSLRVSDLDIAKNPDIEVLTPLDTMVLSITEKRRLDDILETEDEVTESEESEA